ncbi:MAG: hypothetical protein ACI892_001153, partial [Marinobacter maritimus]
HCKAQRPAAPGNYIIDIMTCSIKAVHTISPLLDDLKLMHNTTFIFSLSLLSFLFPLFALKFTFDNKKISP